MKTPWWFLYKTPLAFILWPISYVYYAFGRLVYFFRERKQLHSRRKIVCVGNILAGGVGKTPIVRQIANFLNAPVVMRGYKSTDKTCGVGDEAMMLANDGLLVHTGDRKSNIYLLNQQNEENGPIVMDDGFQNPSMFKDISIVVFDEIIGLGNGFLLPAGPLREPVSGLKRANAVIVVRKNGKKCAKKFSLPYDIPTFFADNKVVIPYSENQKLIAFAGIGYPKKFFDSLKNVVAKRSFPDHYQYTDNDINKLLCLADKKNAKLITTEKDFMRLPEYAREKIKFAKLETTIDKKFFDWLKERLDDNIKK